MARKIGSRYTVTKVLGRGTCGTVWEGEGPDGPVAVKLLREDLAADQTLVARFVQERTALTSLDHPYIVGVRDLVVDGTDLALVMDLVRGSDLRQRLDRDGSLVPQLAASVVADIADGLAAAHAEGIIHRDVKPENILLDEGSDGVLRARIADFGIARLVDGPRRTRATRIIGTPDYLAPEVIEGCQPGPAVDVYALGTVLFELLADWTPFGGGHPGAVLRRHVTEPVPEIPGLPDELGAVLTSCLSKAPAARLTSRELAERLRALVPELAGLPAFRVPDPRAAEAEPAQPTPAEVVAAASGPRRMRTGGAVPLVPSSGQESSRETHVNLLRPIKDEPGKRGEHAAPRSTGRQAAVYAIAAAIVLLIATLSYVFWPHSHHAKAQQPVGRVSSSASAPIADAGLVFTQAHGLAPPPVTALGGPRVVTAAGTSYVFVAGQDGSLWYDSVDGGGTGWRKITGMRLAAEPAAVGAGNRIDLFAVSTADDLLYQRTYNSGSWNAAWTQVPGHTRLRGAPAAALTSTGQLEVAAASTDGDLVAASATGVDGDWQPWATVQQAGRIADGVALLPTGPAAFDAVVASAADQNVDVLSYGHGIWGQPQPVGAVTAGRPEAVLGPGGHAYVFVRSSAGAITVYVPRSGGWGASPVAGVVAAGPVGAAADPAGHLLAAAIGADGRVAVATAS